MISVYQTLNSEVEGLAVCCKPCELYQLTYKSSMFILKENELLRYFAIDDYI